MSYQARMVMPWLIVTGRGSACGKTKRTAGRPRRSSSATMGWKSWPSAPRPCIQITARSGLGPVWTSTQSRRRLMGWRGSRLGTDGRLGSEGFAMRRIGLNVGAVNQLDAVRDRGEHARSEQRAVGIAQAFQRFADGLGLAGQVDDQASAVIRA